MTFSIPNLIVDFLIVNNVGYKLMFWFVGKMFAITYSNKFGVVKISAYRKGTNFSAVKFSHFGGNGVNA